MTDIVERLRARHVRTVAVYGKENIDNEMLEAADEIEALRAGLSITIERCAQVAETHKVHEGYIAICHQIAAAVRALKDKP